MSNNKNDSKTRYIITCFILSFLCFFDSLGQGIKVGQHVPDSLITNIYNYPRNAFRLTDFKKKLILLDFWSPACISCIESFPTIDSLQKQFNGEIQIILVNKESLDSTRHFFAKRKSIFKPDMPFITNDKYFNKLFSVWALPDDAWLDGNGRYYGYTEGWPNSNKIRDFLNGINQPKLEQGRKRLYVPDLFDPAYRKAIGYYSFISQPIDGVNLTGKDITGSGISEDGSIIQLYQRAFDPDGKMHYRRPGRTVVETNDSIRYFRPKHGDSKVDWYKKYCYYYSLSLPPERVADKNKVMQEDLFRYFSIKVDTEKRWIKCMILVRTSDVDKIKSRSLKPVDTFMMDAYRGAIYGPKRELINQPFNVFSTRVGATIEHLSQMPFFDETGYSENIDIRLDDHVLNAKSLEIWQNALIKYDLALIQKDRLTDVLVLNDKK